MLNNFLYTKKTSSEEEVLRVVCLFIESNEVADIDLSVVVSVTEH